MKSRSPWMILAVVVSLGLLIGVWFGQSASQTGESEQEIAQRERPAQKQASHEHSRIPKRQSLPTGKAAFDLDAIEAGAIQGQRWLRFSDRNAMEQFLKSLEGSGISVLASIDALNALRIGFTDSDGLASLLDGSEESGYIFPVTVPDVGAVDEGALGFGRSLLQWLGLEGSNEGAGAGVSVAVLDTGIGESSVFSDNIRRINLIDLPANLADLNGHGTAVASLIASQLGLSPGASLLSVRVANDNGTSDSFTLAQGVIAAADAGVNIINISMGSSGDSSILRSAIEYAQAAGAIIVASAGNDGASRISYPAAYEGVIAVGAVDANGNHLNFSNSGNVTISAPGLSVFAASPGDQGVLFTGTSSSAPVVSSAIAYVMQTQNVSAQQAINMLVQNANDAGAPGYDAALGAGYLDIGRINRLDDPTATDAAIASNFVTQGTNGSVLQVTVQNRGNTTLVNAPVQVTTPSGVVTLNVATLPAGKSQTFDIPLNSTSQQGQEIRIDSSVSLSSGGTDLNPSNNRRVDVHIPADAP
ncbi:S8 family serine peptidase [Haloferula chungangensis]|uniref:S8 family serine peptidase n=1 Tax=Haloferula chungangensis TaxID=1048331 RepID=A0ABW2L3W0_9BACT